MYSGNNFNRTESDNLRVAVSGGLNTAASDLLTPLEDSPDMNNVEVDADGMVRKRRGYRVLQNHNIAFEYLEGSFLIPLTTGSGRPFLLRRAGTGVGVEVKDDTGAWNKALNIKSIFSSDADFTKFSWTKVQEALFDRVIFVGEGHVPIQISYVSATVNFTKPGSGTSWSNIVTPVTFAGSTTGTLVVIVDGVVETVSGVTNTYNTKENILAFSTGNSYPAADYTLELIFVSNQWWAESLIIPGDQFVQTVVQGVSTSYIAVPSILLNGIESYTDYKYPLLPMSSTAYDAVFTFANIPTTSSQYAYSDGSTADGTTRPRPSPYYIAFGAAPATARNVVLSRGYLLPFNGGLISQDTGDLDVVPYRGTNEFVRYTTAPPSEGGAGVGNSIGYHLRNDTAYAVATSTATTRVSRYISLDATNTANGGLLKVAADDTYIIVSTDETTLENAGYLGTNSSSTSIPSYIKSLGREAPVTPFTNYAYPIAGISHFANYNLGWFPTVIASFQGRLVLGGFTGNPLTLVFSNPYDSDLPGYFCNNFDTIYSVVSPVSPFDIKLPGGTDDKITAMIEFNDSLFVFTKYKIYRVHNNGNIVDFSNVKYTLVSNVGCLNSVSVVLTDRYPVFLAPSGVYALVPSDTSSGYDIQEVSAKVRNLVRSNSAELASTGFLLFDAGRSELYVALSSPSVTNRCGIMLVYNTQLNVWFKYTRLGGTGFGAYTGAVVYDSRPGVTDPYPSVMFLTYYDITSFNPYTPDIDEVALIEMNHECPFDVHVTLTTGITLPYTTNMHKLEATATTITDLREFDPNSFSEFGDAAFTMSPILNYEDVYVTLDGVEQTFGTDYVKTLNGSIYFTSAPAQFLSVVLQPRMRYEGSTYHPVGIRINGKCLMPDEYEVSLNGNYYRIDSITPSVDGNDTVEIGYIFPSWYVTPTFNRETLAVKKVKNYIGYFQNDISDFWVHYDTYPSASDVGYRKTPLSVNLAVLFSNEGEGLLQEELYNEAFPTDQPLNQQRKKYCRITVPIIGLGYNYSVVHHNYSPTTFKLAGYEIDVVRKQGKGYSRSEERLN